MEAHVAREGTESCVASEATGVFMDIEASGACVARESLTPIF